MRDPVPVVYAGVLSTAFPRGSHCCQTSSLQKILTNDFTSLWKNVTTFRWGNGASGGEGGGCEGWLRW